MPLKLVSYMLRSALGIILITSFLGPGCASQLGVTQQGKEPKEKEQALVSQAVVPTVQEMIYKFGTDNEEWRKEIYAWQVAGRNTRVVSDSPEEVHLLISEQIGNARETSVQPVSASICNKLITTKQARWMDYGHLSAQGAWDSSFWCRRIPTMNYVERVLSKGFEELKKQPGILLKDSDELRQLRNEVNALKERITTLENQGRTQEGKRQRPSE